MLPSFVLSNVVRSVFMKCGFEIRRARPTHEDFPRLAYFLNERSVAIVLDVGANRGQFAKALFAEGYKGDIVSFEPIPELHSLLRSEMLAFQGRWRLAPRVALSNMKESRSFRVSKNLASSSLFEVLTTSTEAAPESAVSSTIQIETARLDELYDEVVSDSPVFLKIDAQGGEADILDGAKEILNQIIGVKLELSLVRLYEGQVLGDELHTRLVEAGFDCWDVIPGFRNRSTGQLLQYDGVYFRRS